MFVESAAIVARLGRANLPVTGSIAVFEAAAGSCRKHHASVEQAQADVRALRRGRGHPAQLNMGDGIAYAVAESRGNSLLLKGDDLARTDVTPADREASAPSPRALRRLSPVLARGRRRWW